MEWGQQRNLCESPSPENTTAAANPHGHGPGNLLAEAGSCQSCAAATSMLCTCQAHRERNGAPTVPSARFTNWIDCSPHNLDARNAFCGPYTADIPCCETVTSRLRDLKIQQRPLIVG